MSMLGEVVVRLTAVTSGLRQALNDARNQLTDLQNTVRNATEGFQEVGQAAMIAGAAITAGLGYAVKSAADFESQMSRVKALSGATGDEFDKLRQTALDLGATTSFSASQAAEGMTFLASSGFKTQEIIAAMPGLLATAAAGNIDLGRAAEITGDILNGFGISATEAGRVADVLAKTAANSSVELNDLGFSMKYIAPVAAAAGLSLEEMSASVGLMGNAGIKGEQAGTTLRSAILSILDPSKEAALTMLDLGLKTLDANGKMMPLASIVQQLQVGMKGMSDAQKLATMATIFGTEAASGMVALLNEGSAELAKYTNELENAKGSAEEMAKIMKDNLNGALQELQGAFETAMITIGTALTPLVKKLAETLKGLIDKFNQLSPSMQKAVAYTAAGAAVFSLLGGAAFIFISFIPSFITGIKAIGTALSFLAANPIGAVIAAVGLVIIAATALYHAWSTNMGGIQTKTQAVGRYLVSLFNDVVTKISIAFNTLKSKVFSLLQGIMNSVAPVVGVIGEIAPGVENLFERARSAVSKESADIQVSLTELSAKAEHTGTQLDIAGQQVKRAFSSWKTPASSAAKSVKDVGTSAKVAALDVSKLGLASQGAGNTFDGMGDKAEKAGSKGKKAAEDTRTEWEKAVDTLTMKLQILQATHEISNVRLGENAEQAKKLNNDLFYLRKEYDLQKQIVDKARISFENMKRTKGEVSKETAEAAKTYAQEAKALSDLSGKIAETNLALQQRKWITDEARESIEILNAEHEKQTANLSIEAGKLAELQLKQTQLNQTLDAQRVLISDLTHEYEVSRQVKGADSEETRKSYMALIKAQTEEAKLQRELRETAKAISDQTIEFNKLSVKVEELAKKYKDELTKAQTEYADKVSETNRRLADEERKLTDSYEKELDNRTKALRDFVGLFDAVQRKDVSGGELLGNLKGQVDTMKDFDKNIGALTARGISGSLLDELKAIGPKAAGEIAALASMSDVELSEYVGLWEEKSTWAREKATAELQQLQIDTQQKIAELRQDAANQLEQYRIEWEKKTADIRTNTAKDMQSIIDNAKKSGGDMVSTFIEGVRSRFSELRSVMEEMAATVDAYMPHSPAKVGPLSRLDETGVGLIEVFSQGIKKSLPQLDSVTGHMASLVAKKLPGAGSYDSSRNVASAGNVFNITINGTNADEIWTKFEREFNRRGGRM